MDPKDKPEDLQILTVSNETKLNQTIPNPRNI